MGNTKVIFGTVDGVVGEGTARRAGFGATPIHA